VVTYNPLKRGLRCFGPTAKFERALPPTGSTERWRAKTAILDGEVGGEAVCDVCVSDCSLDHWELLVAQFG